MPNNDHVQTQGTDRHVAGGMEMLGSGQKGNATPLGVDRIRPAQKVLRFVIFALLAAAGAAWYVSEVSKNLAPSLAQAPSAQNNKLVGETNAELAQLKQAPQDREKTEKPVRELTAELAQVRQQLQEERGKNEKLAGEVKTALAQLKQAPQDREKTEMPVRELTTELAQVKQLLQEERGKNEKLAGEVKTALAQLKQAPQNR